MSKFEPDVAQSAGGLAVALQAVSNPAVNLLTSVVFNCIAVVALRAAQLLDNLAFVAVRDGSTATGHAISVLVEIMVPQTFTAELGRAALAVRKAFLGAGSSIEDVFACGEGKQHAEKKKFGHHF